jgi:ankyrin repeat protein
VPNSYYRTTIRAAVCLTPLLAFTVQAAGGDGRLTAAAKAKDEAAVATLLRQKLDANAAEPDGATALHWAAHWDDLKMAKALLAAGAKPNAANDYGTTPILLAATNGSAAMIDVLLAAGAKANSALPTGETTLMTAARSGKVDAVNTLLAHGADVNAKQLSKGQTALMWAVSESHHAVVSALLERGADVNAATASGFTPLMFAARAGDVETGRILIAKGARVNDFDHGGSTPLLVATVRGHVPLAKLLLDQGAHADGEAAAAGYTPLHWASTKSEGVITNDYPEAPGEWAALAGIPGRRDKLDLITALLDHGADVNARVTKDLPRYGFTLFKRNYLVQGTPFYLAALVGDTEVMRLLLNRGANPALKARDDTTALMVAAGIAHEENESRVSEKDHLAAVQLVLELGADINAKNFGAMNALHAAAYAGYDTVAQLLVDRGIALNEKTKVGQTALGIAEGNQLSGFFFERRNVAVLLRKLGAVSEGAVSLESFVKGKNKNPFIVAAESQAAEGAKKADTPPATVPPEKIER